MRIHSYNHVADYDRVGRFLVDIYRPEVLRAWLQPRWEYMHFHPMSEGLPFDRCGLAEEGGRVIGFIHFEDNPAFNYLQIRPGHESVASELLDWADVHLGGESRSFGREVLGVFVDDSDPGLEELVVRRGFECSDRISEEHARLEIGVPLPEAPLPDGFRLQSLEDDNDLHKINRVLWRGFNHEGPPEKEAVAGRELAQRAPSFRKDLTIVVSAPNGDYATFAGMWLVAANRVAYVEPVATDPTYRRLGLGRAAVVESIRRAAEDGAEVVWVGSGLHFYQSMGFAIRARSRLWVKSLD
ncbi:MAG: GNAT family N-acetyltransferase [Acidimicrobiia bacterium]|nr:GNAT family N-acetyltransferase [Acidimicrobiia bacterium]